MANVKFEPNNAGFIEMLKWPSVRALLDEKGRQMLGSLPEGYGMKAGETSQRAKVQVYTDTIEAKVDNMKNNSLLKALNVAGGKE